jgi:DNA replication protein DnaC
VKKNFLAGLDIPPGLEAMNTAARHWMESIANVRIHAETRQTPLALFAVEKPALRPLPPEGADTSVTRLVRVSNRCRVTLDTNRYSVPSLYASQRLTLSNSPPPTSASTKLHQPMKTTNHNLTQLDSRLADLRLPFISEHCRPFAATVAKNSTTHLDYLAQLIEGEANQRADRATARRIKAARFPVIKTFDSFRWDWPKKINRLQIQDLFRLQFVADRANVILLGLVGLGKTHLATALGYAACQHGLSVLFANAIDVVNTLHAAQNKGSLKSELRKYTAPALLILDEVGYLPIDQRGADLLFQVISARYERGSIVLTTNKAFKQWPSIFNGDSTITSAVLDRLLHHAETVVIEGSSYRMKDRIET